MEEIGQQLKGLLELLVENFDVKGRRFSGCERVHFTAESVDFARDLGGGTRARALKEHVLDEMGITGLGELLVSRAGVDPNTDRDRLERRYPFGHHSNAVVQYKLSVQGAYPEVWSFDPAPVGAGMVSLRLSRIFPWRSISSTFTRI
jgi:hypothetical protein